MAVLRLFPVDFVIFWGFGGGEVQTEFCLFRSNVRGHFPLWMSAGLFYYLCAWISEDIYYLTFLGVLDGRVLRPFRGVDLALFALLLFCFLWWFLFQ